MFDGSSVTLWKVFGFSIFCVVVPCKEKAEQY